MTFDESGKPVWTCTSVLLPLPRGFNQNILTCWRARILISFADKPEYIFDALKKVCISQILPFVFCFDITNNDTSTRFSSFEHIFPKRVKRYHSFTIWYFCFHTLVLQHLRHLVHVDYGRFFFSFIDSNHVLKFWKRIYSASCQS